MDTHLSDLHLSTLSPWGGERGYKGLVCAVVSGRLT